MWDALLAPERHLTLWEGRRAGASLARPAEAPSAPHAMTDPVPLGATTSRVRSYEVDARGALTLPSLCDLFQEAADRHASTFGAAVDQVVAAYGETWVLYRLAVRVRRAAPVAAEV